MGELVRAVQMPESAFTAEVAKLRGMNETTASAYIAGIDKDAVRQRVYAATNVLQVPQIFSWVARTRISELAD